MPPFEEETGHQNYLRQLVPPIIRCRTQKCYQLLQRAGLQSRNFLIVIRGPPTAQRYVNDILRTVLLPFLLMYPDLIFSSIMLDLIWPVLL
ncbi:hypothetical protein TNCV_4888951 [Trichonephila clavipes]|nr:hypothetical protein TNCV_4888951 [Trichonephila clavipes]